MANHKPKRFGSRTVIAFLAGATLILLLTLLFIPFATDGTWRYSGIKGDVARWAVDWAHTKYPTEQPLVYVNGVRPLRADETERCRYNNTEPVSDPNDSRYYAVSVTVWVQSRLQTYNLGCETLAPPSF